MKISTSHDYPPIPVRDLTTNKVTEMELTIGRLTHALAQSAKETRARERDIAMVSHSLKLAYDCRDALGWNQYTSLSIMPDRIRELVAENKRLKDELAIARKA